MTAATSPIITRTETPMRRAPKKVGVHKVFSAICNAQNPMAKALPGRTATRAAASDDRI